MEYTFYKIYCLDPEVKYNYIGSTRDFIVRKCQHKSVCNNNNTTNRNSKIKLYETIRENGGFSNWDIVPIGTGIYNSNLEARIAEQQYINDNKADLNCVKAYMSKEEENEIKKKYVINNHEKVLQSKKNYRDTHKEEIKEKTKNNIDLQNKRKEKVKCICGGSYTYSHKAEHFKSKLHTSHNLS